MQDSDVKHLEFIQAVVTRQSSNSFLLEGWSITVVVALFAFAAQDADPRFAILALFPATVFWALDAYYLRQERLFRHLYECVRIGDTRSSRTVDLFCMSTKPYQKAVDNWFSTLWTPSILPIHGVIVIIVAIVFGYLSRSGVP